MKPAPNPFLRTLLSGTRAPWQLTLAISMSLLSGAWAANDLYWDSDGATSGGSGGSTASGTWGTSVFWSDSSAGSSATLTATTGNTNDLHFSAGTDVSGTSAITVSGAQSANLLIFEEGTVNISGGTSITLGGGGGVDTGILYNNGIGAGTISTALILGADATFTNLDNSTQIVSGGITGTGNLAIKSNSTGAVTIGTGSLNNAGTVTNSGNGTGLTTISGIVGSSVTGIVQDSQTSALRLTGNNADFSGGVYIKSGTVTGATSANAFGTGAIRLGDDSAAGPANNASATLVLNFAGTYANDVILGNTSGALTITTPNTGTGQTFNGGITGTNNLLISNTGTQTFTFSSSGSKEINNSGTVTNVSSGSGAVTISQKIGSNVTGVIQDVGSGAGVLTLSNTSNSFQNGLIIRRGTVNTSVNGSFGAATNTITLGDSAGAVGAFNDATLQMTAASVNILNPIILEANAAGTLKIASTSTSSTGNSINSEISLNGKELVFAHNGAGSTAFINVHNTAGSFVGSGSIVNAGTGTGYVNLAGTIGSNVTSVTQNSATSQLRLLGNNSFGSLVINAGNVEGRQAAGVTTSLGAGTVTLGGSGTESASLFGQGVNATFGNAIVLGSTSGALTIGSLAATAPVTFTGGITGNNSIHFSSGSNTSGASPVTFSGGAINNAGKVTNSTVTGTSEIFVSSLIGANVTEVVQNSATAGMTLLGDQTYVAPTTVTSGILTLGDGGSLGGTTVTVTNGTFRAAGNQTIGTSGSAALNIGDNGILSLQGGGINTVLLNSVTPGAKVLDFNGTTGTYAVELLGSGADLLQLGAGLQAGVGANPVVVKVNALGLLDSGSRTILSASGGGLDSGGGFALDTGNGNFGGSTISLSNLGTSLVLNVTAAAPAPSVLYFTGALDGNFATFAGGNANLSNFSTDAAGAFDVNVAPDAGTELHIQATSLASATRTLTLGRDFSIKSLVIDSQVANPLTIASGSGSSSLTIAPTSSTDGITVDSSAGGTVNISAPVILGADQTFTNNSANLLTLSGGISGTADLTVKGNATGGVAFSGTADNTYDGTTTVTSGSLSLSKTGGATAIAGDILVNGGHLSFGGDNQIADTASVTVTSGSFNTTAGVPNAGRSSLNEKFASLAVSGDGHFNNGNNSATTGIEVTGNASFTGGSGASFFSGSGGTFSAGSLTLTDMSRSSSPATGAPSLSQISNGFIVFGNNAKQSTIRVGSGGLRMEGTNAASYLALRAGTGGSKVTLDGNVTATGAFATGIVFDAVGGSTGSLSVDLSGSDSGTVTRTFDVSGSGGFTVGVSLANGASSSAGIRKIGGGTMVLSATSSYTGATAIEDGALQLGSGGTAGSLSSSTTITISDGAWLKTSRSNTTNLSQTIGGAGGLEVANTSTGITNLTTTDKTYSGTTVVSGGTLNVSTQLTATSGVLIQGGGTFELGAANRIVDSASLTLMNGGTFNTRGLAETMGTLGLVGENNILNLANGASIVRFANSSGVAWGSSLNILNWTGTANTGGGTDQVIFGSNASGLLDTQLASIFFINPFGDGNDYDAKWSSGMNGEIVPGMVIPEPSALLLLSLGGLGLALRRRRN